MNQYQTILLILLMTFSSLSAQNTGDAQIVEKIANGIISNHKIGYVDRKTKQVYKTTSQIPADAEVYFLSPTMDWHYSLGVLNMAMIKAGKYFGNPAYTKFAVDQVDYALANYKFFEKRKGADSHEPFHFLWKHNELDHCGSESAAMLDILNIYPNKKYKDYIDRTVTHINAVQDRLPDGTLVRSWPYRNTLWADDLYMGLSFLTRMGHYSGDNRFLDDAANQVINFNKYLWNPSTELYNHAYYDDLKRVGGAHWGRCNGWIMLATTMLVDVLPENHAKRQQIQDLLTRQILGVSRYQAPSGLWHQLLDKPDSYSETSCTAIFTYCIAQAINRGWLDKRYAGIAIEGWKGLCKEKITADGVLKDVCVGTGIGNDLLFYYKRPVKDDEVHGLGLIIDTGIEIIELKKNLNLK